MNSNTNKDEVLISASLILQDVDLNGRAIDLTKDALELNPKNIDANIMLAVLYQKEKQFDLSEKFFRVALKLDSNNPKALQGLGLFLMSQNRMGDALPFLIKHIKINPNSIESINGLIKIGLSQTEGRDEIIKAIRTSWKISKNLKIGLNFTRILNDSNESIAILKEVISESPTPYGLTLLGIEYIDIHEFKKAIKCFQEAVALDPTYDYAWWSLSNCYSDLNDHKKALEASEKAISVDPENYVYWITKSTALKELMKYHEVLEATQTAIRLITEVKDDKDSNEIYLLLAFLNRLEVLCELGRDDEFIKECIRALNYKFSLSVLFSKIFEQLIQDDRETLVYEVYEELKEKELPYSLSYILYRVLHQMNNGDEGLNLVGEHLTKNKAEALESMASEGLRTYVLGNEWVAISIFRQLNEIQPIDSRFDNNLAYILIGENEVIEAEELLLKVISRNDNSLFSLIARCNLTYLYVFGSNNKVAKEHIKFIRDSKIANSEAILRIPFCVNGEIKPDPLNIPGRNITLRIAAINCGLTLAIKEGDLECAEKYLMELEDLNTEELILLMQKGCLENAKNHLENAIFTWNKAIEISGTESHKQAIIGWVNLLK
ncbi:MAG: tetratricopeptide repeat protein [Bacteroidales bacterium]|nr:tetratricopeptide repeat protein [Bacteroidales bacterium]